MAHSPAHSTASTYIDDEAAEHLIEKPVDNASLVSQPPSSSFSSTVPKSSYLSSFTRAYNIILHILVIALIAVVCVQNSGQVLRIPITGRSWSPINKHIEFEVKPAAFDYHKHTIYAGPPTHEHNLAWNKLMKPAYFGATNEEMDRAGESYENVTKLVKGGYMASLGAYHDLHCVRQLRFWLYKDFYYPNLTAGQLDYLQNHLDHCLEVLRMAVMCHGSPSLITFNWNERNEPHPKLQSNSRAVCVKWSSIENWSLSRMVGNSPDIIRPTRPSNT